MNEISDVQAREKLLQSASRGNDDALGELIEQFRPTLCTDADRNLGSVRSRVADDCGYRIRSL